MSEGQGKVLRTGGVVTRRSALVGLMATAGLTACSERVPPQVRNLPPEPIPSPTSPPPMQDVWTSLDVMAEAMIANRLTPGLSLSVMRNGNWLYSKGFGLADIARREAVTPQTAFRIGSVSKQFTAAAILLLAEERRLALTDPLALYLPQFPRAADITLLQLLSHTSGLGDYLGSIYPVRRGHDYSADEIVAAINASDPLFRSEPGTAWHYSNSGFALLGLVVEKLADLHYRDFCRWRLFTVAGLGETSIAAPDAEPGTCTGYSGGFYPTVPISPSFVGGAGAISSSSEDLCRWHAQLLNGKILKPASFQAMQAPVRLKNGARVLGGGLDTLGYGLGLALGKTGGARYISHGGLVNGFTAQLRTFPEPKLTVAILCNSDGGGADGLNEAQRALRAEASRLGLSLKR